MVKCQQLEACWKEEALLLHPKALSQETWAV